MERPDLHIKTAYSQSKSEREAVQHLVDQLADFAVSFLLVFASPSYEQTLLCQSLQSAFPSAQIMGCSTAGEIVSQRFLQNSVVAMAFDAEILADMHVEVVENLSELDLTRAVHGFQRHFDMALNDLDYRKYVGLILIDGISRQEEALIESLGDKTNLIFIGGSAGDNLQFDKTYVYAHGKAYSNAAVLAVLKPRNGFEILKVQSFSPSDKELIPTQVNTATRTVFAFNDKPAAQAYAEVLGVKVDDLPSQFIYHPLGLIAEGEIFVRSPQKLNGEAVDFYCQIREGVPLTILNALDIVQDTAQALRATWQKMGSVQGIIDFQCILRTLQLLEEGQTENYVRLFDSIPLVGFSTYGECYLGHMNQTSTMLLFK